MSEHLTPDEIDDREGALREVLAGRAGSVSVDPDPYARTVAEVRRARWRRVLGTVTVACLLAAVGAPVAVFRPFRDVPLESWGARGSLAGNDTFRKAVFDKIIDDVGFRSQDRRVDEGASRVVYLSDDGHVTRAVAVVRLTPSPNGTSRPHRKASGDPSPERGPKTRLVLFAGESGAMAPDLSRKAAFPLPGSPMASGWRVARVAWATKKPNGKIALFVLGPPDTQDISYSTRPRFHANGTWDRTWKHLAVRDGVATGTVPAFYVNASMVRMRLPDATETTWVRRGQVLASPARPDGAPGIQGLDKHLRPVPGLLAAVENAPLKTGIDPGEFEFRALWHSDTLARRVGGATAADPNRRAWLVAATLPDRVTFQVLFWRGRQFTVLVPHGRARRPVAVATSPPSTSPSREAANPRVMVLVPGADGGGMSVELRQGGEKIATAPVENGKALFDGAALARALGGSRGRAQVGNSGTDFAGGDAHLSFHVVDDHGRVAFSGRVHSGRVPPWNRPERLRDRG